MAARPARLALLLSVAISASGLPPDFVRNSVKVPGAEISYLVRQRPGPMLVLIPGSFVGAEDWEETIRNLDPSFSVMIVELRGHGKSWPPPAGGSIEQFAGDVIRAIDDAHVQRFYVGGHSIGGMIAIEIGGRYPDRVRGVLAIEGWTHYSVAANAFGGHNDQTLSAAQRIRLKELRQGVTSSWTPQQMKEFGGIWKTWNGFDRLSKMAAPVLELWGDRNQPHPSRSLMQIPDRPNIELHWIPGASHFLPLERPAEVAQAANAFIHRVAR